MGTGKFVGGEGSKDSDIVIIGEAPGANEARQGRPFVGKAGKLLNKSLINAGIHRQNCYVTNVVKEKPYKNNIKPFIDYKNEQVSEKGRKYIEMLEKELAETDPNVILAVGNIPLWTLTGKSGITKWRGSILEATKIVEGTKVIPIIHPAASLHRGPQAYMYRHYILKDLFRVKTQSEFPELNIPDYEYIIDPSYHQTMQYLKECEESDRVAFDIEVYNQEVDCISFSKERFEAISIPFRENQKEYFTPPQEIEVWKKIDNILSDPDIEVVAHNANFDSSVLFRRYGIKPTNIKDTMINAAVLYPDFPKGLDFLTSIYTKMAYYKDDGKFRNPNVSNRDFWIYNAKDSVVLQEIYPKQVKELERMGNLETAQKQTRLIRPLLYMYGLGIKMNTELLNKKRDRAQEEMVELRKEISEIAGHKDLNPNSYKQVKEYFYEELGLDPYRKKGKPTTNELAMKRLSRRGYREAEIVLEYRGLSKAKGSYYEMEFDDDNRLRSSFNPVGTRTGRLSSSKTIFDTGGNMQNLTVPFKECMNPDEEHVGYEIDLGQAENRVVAYLGPDPRMIKAFETGTDIHKLTATMVFNKPIEKISAEKGSASIGNGKQSERYWGKQGNHSFNYDLGYRSFSRDYEIPVKDGKYIYNSYHKMYPGVRKMHEMVKQQLRKNRTLENLFGRKYRFMGRFGDSMFKEAYAFIPQSTVADIINRWGLLEVYYNQEIYRPIRLLSQVHDSIVFQISTDYDWAVHARVIRELCKSMEKELEFHGRRFSIPAEVTVFPNNFKDGHELEEVTHLSNMQLADSLEDTYSELVRR